MGKCKGPFFLLPKPYLIDDVLTVRRDEKIWPVFFRDSADKKFKAICWCNTECDAVFLAFAGNERVHRLDRPARKKAKRGKK